MKKQFFEKLKISAVPLPSVLKTLAPFLILTLLWIVIEALIHPFGEFPFSDDWMYARSVNFLVTDGVFKLCDFQAVTLLAQTLWGALFSLFFGFSMTTLRFSVIVLGWVGLGVVYGMMKEATPDRKLAFLGSVTMATTPFYVLFSNTFMTDVPFIVTATASFIFLIRWIKRERLSDLIFGIALACVTSLIRQLAFFIPLSFSVAYLIRKEFKPKAFLVIGLACGMVAGTLFLYHAWLQSFGGVPWMYTVKQGVFRGLLASMNHAFFLKLVGAFFFRMLVVCMYLGIFLFPLMLLLWPVQWERFSPGERRWGGACAAVYGVAVLILLRKLGLTMPLGMDQWFNFGLGCEHVEGGNAYLPKAPRFLWEVLTGVGLVGSAWLVFLATVTVKRFGGALYKKESVSAQWAPVLCLAACAIHFIPFGISGHFDRYQLVYIPFVIFGMMINSGPVSWSTGRLRMAVALVLLALIGYFSVAATHDFMTRNRTRWDVLRYLMIRQGIPPGEIDGGYEFNGWYTYDSNYHKKTGMNWWWVADDQYRISYNPSVEGYVPLHGVSYKRWLPPGEGYIFILKRLAEKRPAGIETSKTVYDF
ncbi:MAG TPA: glycosyltransferase family 39 protein [Candidatus Omnitrophota bacterium]|nr:glycosyltransferase family 39 protein [Candidatus Omnitrophota bacterium]HPS37231.1 glycosyltransferase family 39 protein [Candidatus Omnitrophota bacterium]